MVRLHYLRVVGLGKKALHAIIGDYKGQFRHIGDYLYEVYKKNPGTIIK